MDDPLPPLRVCGQQLAEREEPADDVLGQLGPVDPHEHLAVAELVAQRGEPDLDVTLGGPRLQAGHVDPEGVDVDPDDPTVVLDGQRAVLGAGRDSGAEDVGAAAGEGLRPPTRVEARPSRRPSSPSRTERAMASGRKRK